MGVSLRACFVLILINNGGSLVEEYWWCSICARFFEWALHLWSLLCMMGMRSTGNQNGWYLVHFVLGFATQVSF